MLKDELRFEEYVPELNLADDAHTAFIKTDKLNGKEIWVIYAADGTKLASTENRELAYVVAKQNNYEVMSAH